MISTLELDQNEKGAFIMARTRIEDLPKDMEISKTEMKRILGGIGTWPTPERPFLGYEGGPIPLRFVKVTGCCGIETVPLPE